jgi:3-hydroxyisobutyrate dehydrogenase-like beta-hydroxyacid dehydrogenase
MSERTAAVSVLGTGTMGSALARALLQAGHQVTVWNRTATRAAPLAELGATVAAEPTDAIGASPTVIVCVASPAVVNDLLGRDDVRSSLQGRTLVQLTTGRPAEVRRGVDAAGPGIVYLGGAILAYPRMVGTAEAMLLFGGEPEVYERARPVLEALGTVRFLGPDPAAPSAMDAALIAFFYGSLAGFLHGARIARAEGLELELYGSLAGPFVRDFVAAATADAAARIVSGDWSEPQSSIDTHFGGIDDLVIGTSRDAGLEAPVMAAIRDELAAAIAAGNGGLDIASLLDSRSKP